MILLSDSLFGHSTRKSAADVTVLRFYICSYKQPVGMKLAQRIPSRVNGI